MIMAHVSISNHEKSQRMKWTKYNDKLNKDEDISLKSWNNEPMSEFESISMELILNP